MKKIIVGIAGYIGSGKSTAGEYFKSKGAEFIDADKVVDDLYQPGQDGHIKLVNFFGEDFLLENGYVNRKKLAKFVFGDVNKLKILNNLIHPLVFNAVKKIIDKSSAEITCIEATYFEQKYLGGLVDTIIWVESSFENICKRMPELDVVTLNKIIKTQGMPEKIDFKIDNDGGKNELFAQLDKIWNEIYIKYV